jgi:hypothetical protein
MNEDLICPDCGRKLNRDYGLPGVVLICDCGKRWVKFVNRLISVEELHQRAANEP